MPYPPPPGPPDVGEFQAIGKLPAPQLPDVTGHGGEFLETDGIIPQWEPVVGVLPDQTGHAGEFLTTDGAVASWSAVTGVLPDQTGHGGEFLTTDGAAASWAVVPARWPSSVYDITNYGAVANDPTNDAYPAIVAAIAAWTIQNGLTGVNRTGGIYIPEGTFYVSRPVFLPPYCELFGASKIRSILSVGIGNNATPSNVQSFAGPLLYVTGTVNRIAYPYAYPQYGAPLVGATGQSMVMDTLNVSTPTPPVVIGDSYPWTAFLDSGPAAMTLRCWVDISSSPNFGPIVGSMGSFPWSVRYYNGQYDCSVLIYSQDVGGGIELCARITTSNEGQIIISSGVVGAGPHNVELNFGGGHFRFFVDGTAVGDETATGVIVRRPWELAMVGAAGNIDTNGPFPSPVGLVDSIELSNVVRHTANFTPPAAKYSADANTLWLCNFDQGDAPDGNQPLMMAQSITGDSPTALKTHYCRLGLTAGTPFAAAPFVSVHDLWLDGRSSAAGLLCLHAYLGTYRSLEITRTCNWGFRLVDGDSFFSKASDLRVETSYGFGIGILGELDFAITVACGIGFWIGGGSINSCSDQPNASNFMSYVVGLIGGQFAAATITGCSVDAEQPPYPNQRCAALFWMGPDAAVTCQDNSWDTSSGQTGVVKAVVLYYGAGHTTHIGDSFFQNPVTQGPYPLEWAQDTPPLRRVTLKNCKYPYNTGHLPPAVREDFLNVEDGGTNTGAIGLSTSLVPAQNLAGQLYVPHGFTTGIALFPVPEPDIDYLPVITLETYLGSAPAANSTVITGIQKFVNQFQITTAADPGGTCQLVFDWHLVRVALAQYFNYEPTLPSSVANPFDGLVDRDFAVACVLVPVGSNSFILDVGVGTEVVAESGTTPGGDSWQIALNNAGGLVSFEIGGTGLSNVDAFVSEAGQLRSMLSPGSHQLAITYSSHVINLYLDGQAFPGLFTGAFGTQDATVLIGQHAGGTDLLASATMRDFKIGKSLASVLSGEPDVGPGTQIQCAFFGDDLTLGNGATLGSYASQTAIARYGTRYYWSAAKLGGRYRNNPGYTQGLVNYFWRNWGSSAGLEAICLLAGYWDLVVDQTATDIWADVLAMLEGGFASSTFTPNAQNAYAWAHLYPPNIPAAPGSFTLAGVVFNLTGDADTQAGSNVLKGLIDADGTTGPLVTAQVLFDPAQPGGGRYYVNVQARAAGAAGNAITLTYDGGGGEAMYPVIGHLGFGVDATITIIPSGGAPVVLLSNFDTDADTTVNNLIGLIAADVTLNPVVTGTLVNHKLLLTANNPGSVGNEIGVAANAVFTQHWDYTPGPGPDSNSFLNGGFDGAIQLGTSTIVLCTVPPFGTNVNWTAPREVERAALNALIVAYAGAHPGDVTLADADTTLADGGTPVNLNPAYDAGNGYTLNDAGQTALFGLIDPLLP